MDGGAWVVVHGWVVVNEGSAWLVHGWWCMMVVHKLYYNNKLYIMNNNYAYWG